MSEKGNWGYTIKRLREERGMSQTYLANKTGFSKSYVSRLESGTYKEPKHGAIVKLASALNLTLPQLNAEIQGYVKDTPRPRFQEIMELAKIAQPVEIPVYKDFPRNTGGGAIPLEYVYRERDARASNNIEGYLVNGSNIESVRDGDVIIVDRDAKPKVNDIVYVLVDDNVYLGILKGTENQLFIVNNDVVIDIKNADIVTKVIERITKFP